MKLLTDKQTDKCGSKNNLLSTEVNAISTRNPKHCQRVRKVSPMGGYIEHKQSMMARFVEQVSFGPKVEE